MWGALSLGNEEQYFPVSLLLVVVTKGKKCFHLFGRKGVDYSKQPEHYKWTDKVPNDHQNTYFQLSYPHIEN